MCTFREFRSYLVSEKEFKQVCSQQFNTNMFKKPYMFEVFGREEKYCCCDFLVRIMQGGKVQEYCPLCGKEAVVEGGCQMAQFGGIKVGMK